MKINGRNEEEILQDFFELIIKKEYYSVEWHDGRPWAEIFEECFNDDFNEYLAGIDFFEPSPFEEAHIDYINGRF